jgi:hypothetical protein
MRARLRLAVGLAAALVVTAGAVRVTGAQPEPAVAAVIDHGDSGDEQVLSSFDGAMVRKRAAIGVLPARGADVAGVRAELLRLWRGTGQAGTPADGTFAVFSEQMLEYMVPQVTLVAPEGVTLSRAEAFMRDHQPDDVAFYLTEQVLVHDITFAALPAQGVDSKVVSARLDAEGILTDELNHYVTTVQPAGITVRYFGAVLSDRTIRSVREAMGRAAQVPADRVQVTANLPGPGVDMSQGIPDLSRPHGGHHG